MSRLATIQSHISIDSTPTGVSILNDKSTISIVGEGVNIQVNGDNQNNAYISADIIQPPQPPVQQPGYIEIESVERKEEGLLFGGFVKWQIAFVIWLKLMGLTVQEVEVNPDGSFQVLLTQPGLYTLESSTDPSIKAHIVYT